MKIHKTPKKMYWRVIVRFSLTRDKGSVVRNLIITKLRDVGLKITKTGLWEGQHCQIIAATKMLTDVIKSLSRVSSKWVTGGPYLNHLWVYVDFYKTPTKVSN